MCILKIVMFNCQFEAKFESCYCNSYSFQGKSVIISKTATMFSKLGSESFASCLSHIFIFFR